MTNTLCRSLARLVPLLIAPTLLGSPTTQPSHRDGPFLIGADISWVQEDEANGAVYYDRGRPQDIFRILKDHAFNAIRLRVFVDPGGLPCQPVSGERRTRLHSL